MSPTPDDFDLDAAWIRRAQTDIPSFMEALAVRLSGSLPDRVSVDRRRKGLFSPASSVHSITVTGEGALYKLSFEKGQLRAARSKLVRGVVISTTQPTVADWLAELNKEVGALAGSLSAASGVLGEFL